MPDQGQATLRSYFLNAYGELLKTVSRRLGSRERAEDALHDAYLRLERVSDADLLQSPRAYLVRMALNIAANNRRSETRASRGSAALKLGDGSGATRLSSAEGDAVLRAVDEAPDAEQIAMGRSELRKLGLVMAELPARRRAIFEAAWAEGLSHPEIAARFNIAVRTVQQELKLAREHCLARFEEGL